MTTVESRKTKKQPIDSPDPKPIPAPVVMPTAQDTQASPVYRADVVLFLFWMSCMFLMAALIAYESIAGLLGKR